MKLVIEDEAGTRSIVPFTDDAIVVGRGPEGVTFRLADRNVSRRHARFVRQSGSVVVEDLGSLIGTRVNGERISGRRRLRDGDLVQIGDYDLAVVTDAVALDARGSPPPPLPAAPRSDPRATATPPPAGRDAARPPPPSEGPPVPSARASRGRAVKVALATGVLALAVGLAAGWAVGALTVN